MLRDKMGKEEWTHAKNRHDETDLEATQAVLPKLVKNNSTMEVTKLSRDVTPTELNTMQSIEFLDEPSDNDYIV
jgi:hypothetical protein